MTSLPHPTRPADRARQLDLRHFAVAFGVFFAWSEVSQAWRHWGPAGLIFTYTGFIPLQIASAVALFRAARRADLPQRVRQALATFGTTFLVLALGSIALAFIAVTSLDEPRYTWADLFYLLSYPLMIGGLLLLPRTGGEARRRSRQLLDFAALVLISAILVYIHRELRADWTGFSQVLATIYPALALGGLLAANTALARGLPVPSRRAWRMLVFALAVNLLTDVIFQTLWATGYQGPNWSLPLAVGVNLAMLWAGDWYAHDPIDPQATDSGSVIPFSPLPILLAVGGAGVLLLVALQGNVSVVQPVLITLILLNVLLVIREFMLVVDATRTVRRETVRESARRFEALVRHSTDLILVLDGEGLLRFVSPASATLLARSPEELTGTPLERLLHADEVDGVDTALAALLDTPGRTVSLAFRLHHVDGSWRRFEFSIANLMDEAGVNGLVLNGRDVTDRTLLEEQLRQAQKMEVVGQLAGGVAHDFNNLLTTVLAGSEMALAELDENHPLRPDIESIRIAAQRGAALTGRLLAFSRPRGADPRVVRVAVPVENALPLMQRLLGDSYRIQLVDGGSGAARLDPDELEHALLNLVANARDAMPAGGTIRITVTDRTLERPLASRYLPVPAGRYVVIEVADSGSGMTPEVQDHLFQPFYTTKPAGQGTGLGLAGVFAFLRRSRGGITVDSAVGEGARFGLWLPRAAPAEEAGVLVENPASAPGRGTVMLVEDDDVVRQATRRILGLGGYTVVEAANAAEARVLFQDQGDKIDLVVTDVMMPGESGASLAAALRRLRPGLPVLYISGYPGEDLERLGLLLGEVELLRKPFTMRELTERVGQVLGGIGP